MSPGDWSAELAKALGHDWAMCPIRDLGGMLKSDARFRIVAYERLENGPEPRGQWMFRPVWEIPQVKGERSTMFFMDAWPRETLAQAHKRLNGVMTT